MQNSQFRLCKKCAITKPIEKFDKYRGYFIWTCRKCRKDARGDKDKNARRTWQNLNRDKVRLSNVVAYAKNRVSRIDYIRARQRGFVVGHTRAEWRALKAFYGNRCIKPGCGATRDITRDHVIPIKSGGTDHILNIQPLCRSCNSSKGAKEIDYRTK